MELVKSTSSALTNTSNKGTIAALLESQKKQIALALPKHLTPDRLMRVALTAMSKNSRLLECSPTSLLGAVIQSAQLGLEPDGALGEAYLIPFAKNFKDDKGNWQRKMECQFMPGYRGIAKLVRNSGEVISVSAKEVCENDLFEFEYGSNEKLIHRPAMSNRGAVIYLYAYARLKDGGFQFEIMSKEEVDLIKYQSFRKNNPKDKNLSNSEIERKIDGVWKDYYTEMARKTVFKKLSKYLPMSVEAARVFEIEENRELGRNITSDILNIDTTTGEMTTLETDHDYQSEAATKTTMKPEDLVITEAKIVEETTTTNANPPAAGNDEEFQSVFTSGLINSIGKTKSEKELNDLIANNTDEVNDFKQSRITQIQMAAKLQYDILKKKGTK